MAWLQMTKPRQVPTPVYLNHLARPGSLRRAEQIDRQRALQAQSESIAQARAQAKANRRSTAATQAQSRPAREREQAQRKVDAEARREASDEIPQPTSDLMKRMGFSEQEIAAQKAREHPAKPGAKETTDAVPQAEHQLEQAKPAAEPGSAASHPTLSQARPMAPRRTIRRAPRLHRTPVPDELTARNAVFE